MHTTGDLSDRARGWLRYLHRKAFTPDNWDKGGQPLPWWDAKTTPPMMNWHRFDLLDSSYALALMADRTPAWREVYGGILDQLVARHTSYWAAMDWLTQIGPDPDRDKYPEAWYGLLLPSEYRGNYDAPGWTANGVEPWGLQMDPIGADGNLFFKGFFNLILGIHRYVSGDEKWNHPFDMVRDGPNTFHWSYHAISDYLASQWRARPDGCHCENTKIWPHCLSGAGLGLMMHDAIYRTKYHEVFETWWENTCSKKYMSLPPTGHPQWLALYYDPIIDHIQHGGPFAGIGLALYLTPQIRDVAKRFYDWAADVCKWRDPNGELLEMPDSRFHALGYALATEFADGDAISGIRTHAERRWQPTWKDGEFFWGFGLEEEHPRGQLNANIMLADVGMEGAWWNVFNRPNFGKYEQPSVLGVDFPRIGVSRAFFDEGMRRLNVKLDVRDSSMAGERTSFRIANAQGGQNARVTRNNVSYSDWWTTPTGEIQVITDAGEHEFIVEMEASL